MDEGRTTGAERAERAEEHQGRGVYVIHLCKCVDVPRYRDCGMQEELTATGDQALRFVQDDLR